MARVTLSYVHLQHDRLSADTDYQFDAYVKSQIMDQMKPPDDPRMYELSMKSLRDQYVHATHAALRERGISVEGSPSIADSVYTLIGMLLVEQMQMKDQIAALKKERERVA